MTKVDDKMYVEYINHMGNDLTVVNAARVSFSKESSWEGAPIGAVLKEKDAKLVDYLAKHGHWSPFSHCFMQFRIKAPIFVARQLAKHQVGLSWNEVSRRYVDEEPVFYIPPSWRGRAANVKQGSTEEGLVNSSLITKEIYPFYDEFLYNYQFLLNEGVAPEQARMILPQSTYTEWYWSGSLYAFARVCKQRLDSHAQKETQEVAEHISEVAKDLFPVSWNALLSQ